MAGFMASPGDNEGKFKLLPTLSQAHFVKSEVEIFFEHFFLKLNQLHQICYYRNNSELAYKTKLKIQAKTKQKLQLF